MEKLFHVLLKTVSMAFLLSSTHTKGWVVGKGNNGSRLGSYSKLLQLPGRDLISERQRDSSEIALSQDFTTASHRVCMLLS